MANKDILVETLDSIKVVRFNKPKRKNAIDVEMYNRVTKILNDTANEADISVLVLTGTGDYYSSGNDLLGTYERTTGIVDVLKDFINAFINFPKTLVAVVNGPAIGIAATTLALCDLVFAVDTAYFLTPFSKLGIVAEGCSTLTFPRLMGDRKAAEMLLFSKKLSAREALECGFINYIYKPEELQRKVWDVISEVSQLPQESVTKSKSLIRRTLQDELHKTNEAELLELQKIWSSSAYTDSVANFISKKNSSKSKL